MSLTKCAECGHQISSKATACPQCGAKPVRTRWWLVIPGMLVAAFLIFALINPSTPEDEERIKQRTAIEFCWQEHERKSLDPGTKRFVASACERMENEFRRRFRREP